MMVTISRNKVDSPQLGYLSVPIEKHVVKGCPLYYRIISGSEKPAFTALKNMISLLKDPGANFTPGALDYTLSGNTTNIHHTLLQKRNGTFYLILWQEVSSFDPDAKQNINVTSRQVTLTLNQPIGSANTYLPNNSKALLKSATNPNKITLNVPDYPLVVELPTLF